MPDEVDDFLDEEIGAPPPVQGGTLPVEDAPADPLTDPVELPADIAKIWDTDGYGAFTAQTLIREWGEDVFRRSSIHAAANREAEREAKMQPIRKAFIAAKGGKG